MASTGTETKALPPGKTSEASAENSTFVLPEAKSSQVDFGEAAFTTGRSLVERANKALDTAVKGTRKFLDAAANYAVGGVVEGVREMARGFPRVREMFYNYRAEQATNLSNEAVKASAIAINNSGLPIETREGLIGSLRDGSQAVATIMDRELTAATKDGKALTPAARAEILVRAKDGMSVLAKEIATSISTEQQKLLTERTDAVRNSEASSYTSIFASKLPEDMQKSIAGQAEKLIKATKDSVMKEVMEAPSFRNMSADAKTLVALERTKVALDEVASKVKAALADQEREFTELQGLRERIARLQESEKARLSGLKKPVLSA